MALDLPRSMDGAAGDPFPVEWNKIPARFRDLETVGAFRQAAAADSRVVAEVILMADLYFGVADGKVVGRLVSWDGSDLVESAPAVERDVYADRMSGYLFAGDIVRAELCGKNGRWYAIDDGIAFCRGTATTAISKGGSGDIDIGDDTTIPAMTVFGDIANGALVGLAWDCINSLWIIIAAEC